MLEVLEALEKLASRIEQLEVKLSFHEDHIEVLNTTLFRQQEQIASLIKEMGLLHERLQSFTQANPSPTRDPAAELPPHY